MEILKIRKKGKLLDERTIEHAVVLQGSSRWSGWCRVLGILHHAEVATTVVVASDVLELVFGPSTTRGLSSPDGMHIDRVEFDKNKDISPRYRKERGSGFRTDSNNSRTQEKDDLVRSLPLLINHILTSFSKKKCTCLQRLRSYDAGRYPLQRRAAKDYFLLGDHWSVQITKHRNDHVNREKKREKICTINLVEWDYASTTN